MAGVELIDHEVITLLRAYGVSANDGIPRISGPLMMQAAGLY